MAIKIVTAYLLGARFYQLVDACDITKISSGLVSCQQQLGDIKGDYCSRYTKYVKCNEDLLANCPETTKNIFKITMQNFENQFGSKLDDCSSGSTSGNEEPSGPCSSVELQSKHDSCLRNFNAAVDKDNVCPAWGTWECCFKDAFASCGKDTQSEISAMIKDRLKYFWKAKECASPKCSSEVETTLMTDIQFSTSDATREFTLDKYKEAVKKATGLELPEVVLKAFEIVVSYVLPDATPIAKAEIAIAKLNNVSESQVQVTQGSARRLSVGRRLAMDVDVTITVPDASKAADVQASAADTTGLESEIGGAVSLAKEPVTLVKIETKVNSAPSLVAQLKSQIENAGADVDGEIKAEMNEDVQPSGASSNVGIAFAASLMLLMAAI